MNRGIDKNRLAGVKVTKDFLAILDHVKRMLAGNKLVLEFGGEINQPTHPGLVNLLDRYIVTH